MAVGLGGRRGWGGVVRMSCGGTNGEAGAVSLAGAGCRRLADAPRSGSAVENVLGVTTGRALLGEAVGTCAGIVADARHHGKVAVDRELSFGKGGALPGAGLGRCAASVHRTGVYVFPILRPSAPRSHLPTTHRTAKR